SEYKAYIFPLAYLVDRRVMDSIKAAGGFEERVDILSSYYNSIIEKYSGSFRQVDIVTQVLDDAWKQDRFDVPIGKLAKNYQISARTLQRYFEAATSISSKQALQIMRIRKAVEQLTTDPENFHFSQYGYYDYSHFYKHLRQFLNTQTIDIVKPHLHILQGKFGV
ncbi:MAG: helix-turn-helix domain-containing protein, partial [Flavisolibacter sp.]